MKKETRRAVIAGNWKMNKTPSEAKALWRRHHTGKGNSRTDFKSRMAGLLRTQKQQTKWNRIFNQQWRSF